MILFITFWAGCLTCQNGFIVFFSLWSIYPFTQILFSRFVDLHDLILFITFWNVCRASQDVSLIFFVISGKPNSDELYSQWNHHNLNITIIVKTRLPHKLLYCFVKIIIIGILQLSFKLVYKITGFRSQSRRIHFAVKSS